MITTKIPRHLYSVADYPNLEDRADGMRIPELWGSKDNITPVCIDTEALIYKWQRRASSALRAVRADDILLVENTDYTKNLSLSTITLIGTPFLNPSTQYYLVLSGDYALSGDNYVRFAGIDGGTYDGGQGYRIDGSNNWTDDYTDMFFHIFGKPSLDAQEETLYVEYIEWNGWRPNFDLRTGASRTRIAQSFTTPAGEGFFISRIYLYGEVIGNPSGNVYGQILSAYNPSEVAVGGMSIAANAGSFSNNINFHQRGVPSKLSIDADGVLIDSAFSENVADIVKDAFVNILEIPLANMDTDALSDLKSKNTSDFCCFLDTETTFNSFMEKFEASALFKWLPNFDQKHTFRYCASDYPSETIHHFKRHEILSLKLTRKWSSVYDQIMAKFNEDATTKEAKTSGSLSNIAKYVYNKIETLNLTTYLKDANETILLTAQYRSMLEHPQLWVEFEVYGDFGLLLPLSRIRLTLDRACYTNGYMEGVLFRLFSVEVDPIKGKTKFIALLDSQSYGSL